jgi:hypothetical protein
MTGEELKAWLSAGREALGFIRDALTTEKELRERRALAKQTNPTPKNKTPRKKA